MHHSKNKNLIYLILAVFLISCEGEVGSQGVGLNSMTNVTNEPAGANCENGGVKIEVGTDSNENGVLDTGEVLSTSYVCNGVDGTLSLTIVTTEPAGTNCENGGIKIESGVDTNGDGTLDGIEISATAYVCNGVDGNNSLTKITNESAGTNCENGGLKIDSGVDANSNGTLEDTEISATAYVCNGIDGNNSLTKITSEAAGANCENGGLRIDTGVDSDSDGILDDSEITATAYVCNGLDGNVSLVNITDETEGSNCENSGVKIDSGLDDNGDGTLDDDEIEITRYICNGVDGGFDEQIRLVIIDPGTSGLPTNSTRLLGDLINFDKSSWLGVDSAVFVANISGSSAFVELYDLTNDQVITNSTLSTTNSTLTELKSNNIFNDLPDSSIDLTIQLRSGNGSSTMFQKKAYLFMYRKN